MGRDGSDTNVTQPGQRKFFSGLSLKKCTGRRRCHLSRWEKALDNSATDDNLPIPVRRRVERANWQSPAFGFGIAVEVLQVY